MTRKLLLPGQYPAQATKTEIIKAGMLEPYVRLTFETKEEPKCKIIIQLRGEVAEEEK